MRYQSVALPFGQLKGLMSQEAKRGEVSSDTMSEERKQDRISDDEKEMFKDLQERNKNDDSETFVLLTDSEVKAGSAG